MFKGTIRFNLDPFSNYSDEEVWNALEAVELKGLVQQIDKKLEGEVRENGSNFSAGEKQLFCLARAILRHNKFLSILFFDF